MRRRQSTYAVMLFLGSLLGLLAVFAQTTRGTPSRLRSAYSAAIAASNAGKAAARQRRRHGRPTSGRTP